jgi:mannose-6-phosphate isomerase-like protein (cupin superfamily)
MSVSLIGGTGISRVVVYTQRLSPDGQHGGSPHIHSVTDEAYYVTKGMGWVELHDLERGFRRVRLETGTYVDFEPGVLHRLVNEDGLELLAIMGNAGLPEAGDARMYFGPEVDASPDRYEELWTLPRRKGLEGALERRDRAIEAYAKLVRLWDADRESYFSELRRFIETANRAAEAKKEAFGPHIESGPQAKLEKARARLAHLGGTEEHPVVRRQAQAETVALGMCGQLYTVLQPEVG